MAIRGATNKQVLATRQVGAGERTSTGTLDGTTTTEIIKIGNPGSKISIQRAGTLQADVTFSLNGVDYEGTVAVTTAAIASYTDHIVTHIKVVRTAGTGKMTVAIS